MLCANIAALIGRVLKFGLSRTIVNRRGRFEMWAAEYIRMRQHS